MSETVGTIPCPTGECDGRMAIPQYGGVVTCPVCGVGAYVTSVPHESPTEADSGDRRE